MLHRFFWRIFVYTYMCVFVNILYLYTKKCQCYSCSDNTRFPCLVAEPKQTWKHLGTGPKQWTCPSSSIRWVFLTGVLVTGVGWNLAFSCTCGSHPSSPVPNESTEKNAWCVCVFFQGSLLHLAAMRGHQDMVQMLVHQRGADIDPWPKNLDFTSWLSWLIAKSTTGSKVNNKLIAGFNIKWDYWSIGVDICI